MEGACGPLRRTMPIPPRPGGVEMATIVSSGALTESAGIELASLIADVIIVGKRWASSRSKSVEAATEPFRYPIVRFVFKVTKVAYKKVLAEMATRIIVRCGGPFFTILFAIRESINAFSVRFSSEKWSEAVAVAQTAVWAVGNSSRARSGRRQVRESPAGTSGLGRNPAKPGGGADRGRPAHADRERCEG